MAAGLGWLLHRLRVRELRASNAVLDERARLSRELHDNLSQTMTGIILQLDAARHAQGEFAHPGAAYLERAVQLAHEGFDATRRTLSGLRPIELVPEASLAEVLQRNIERLTAGTAIVVVVRTLGVRVPLRPEVELELFRICQEAATNALRHSGARRIEVTLSFQARGIRLRLSDDGRGFNVNADSLPSQGLGMAGMRARAEHLHGELKVVSVLGAGTCIDVYLPYLDPT